MQAELETGEVVSVLPSPSSSDGDGGLKSSPTKGENTAGRKGKETEHQSKGEIGSSPTEGEAVPAKDSSEVTFGSKGGDSISFTASHKKRAKEEDKSSSPTEGEDKSRDGETSRAVALPKANKQESKVDNPPNKYTSDTIWKVEQYLAERNTLKYLGKLVENLHIKYQTWYKDRNNYTRLYIKSYLVNLDTLQQQIVRVFPKGAWNHGNGFGQAAQETSLVAPPKAKTQKESVRIGHGLGSQFLTNTSRFYDTKCDYLMSRGEHDSALVTLRQS